MTRFSGVQRSVFYLGLILSFYSMRMATTANAAENVEAKPGPNNSSSPVSSEATHEQVKVIRCNEGARSWTLACFATTKDKKILAVIVPPENKTGSFKSGSGSSKNKSLAGEQTTAEVRVMDSDGKLLSKWPLDFLAQAVNVGPDGLVYLAGDGSIARYNMEGKRLAKAESPQVVAGRQNPAELERRAREQLKQEQNFNQEMIQNLEAQKKALAAKKDEELDEDEKVMKKSIDQSIAHLKRAEKSRTSQELADEQVKERIQELSAQARRTNAIAVNDKFVFATGPASKGYGYRVWRTDLNFQNAVAIVDGLSGCCGQMDIQCCGDEVVVAENSRHRVSRYDMNGKLIASFGKRSRDGSGSDFGGCCNPMNTRAVGEKLLVAESDGKVKLFTREGRYEGIVGVAKVEPGCKSSTVAVTPGQERVYYIDVHNSEICVLDRKSGRVTKEKPEQASTSASKPKS